MTREEADFNAWIRRYHPSDRSTGRLICFPHAGGSASYYFPVSQRFSPGIDVLALQYPGRQDRRQEACIKKIDVLADKIADKLAGLSDAPTLFFGHSMGATLAFEVAWRLQETGRNAPRAVIASGRSAPGIPRSERIHQCDDAGIIAEVRKLNGTDSTLLEDEEILRMSLPSIRGDYEAIETYSYTPGRILNCPITAFTGDSDPRTTIEAADAWRHYTKDSFRFKIFPGGHFYLNSNNSAVMAEVAVDLEQMIKRASTHESSPVILSLTTGNRAGMPGSVARSRRSRRLASRSQRLRGGRPYERDGYSLRSTARYLRQRFPGSDNGVPRLRQRFPDAVSSRLVRCLLSAAGHESTASRSGRPLFSFRGARRFSRGVNTARSG
jgi:surfactin synthase thioesterase subunit